MLEVEAKIRIADVASLRSKLAALGAMKGEVLMESDLFFQHPARDFVETDEALRLRDVNGALTLTYKGPNQSASLKIREEHNVLISDDPTTLLASLGFKEAARLEKEREHWTLGEANLSIDTLAAGTFLEVEVIGEDNETASAEVERILEALSLSKAPRLTESYLALAERHRAR